MSAITAVVLFLAQIPKPVFKASFLALWTAAYVEVAGKQHQHDSTTCKGCHHSPVRVVFKELLEPVVAVVFWLATVNVVEAVYQVGVLL